MSERAPGVDRTDLAAARAAKSDLLEQVGSLEGVNGVGLVSEGGHYALRVNLVSPESSPSLPDDVDGFPVVTRVVGPLSAQ